MAFVENYIAGMFTISNAMLFALSLALPLLFVRETDHRNTRQLLT